MNILWTVNKLPPDVARVLGVGKGHAISWVEAMSKRLSQRSDVTLAIACPGKVSKVMYHQIDGIQYIIIPDKCDKVDYWADILVSFHPDVIHAYGTEGRHNLLLLKNHSDIPILISLQGILTEYQRHFYAGIDCSVMLRFLGIKDFISPTCFFTGRKNYKRRAKYEREQLTLAKYVEGRSTWDRVSALRINPNLKYFYCPRMIRSPFFEKSWAEDRMEKHSILVHQALYPIKGLHFVLEAVSLLRVTYPDIKLYIVGRDYLHPERLSRRLFQSGYAKYLKHLIRELKIEDLIHYTGILSANQLAEKLSQVNVHIVPSSIENAPNSLAESMIVGTPTIASFVGGNMDMLAHNEEGFLYCYNEPNMLAEYVRRVFDSESLAQSFSQKSKATARQRHNPLDLECRLIDIYSQLVK